jgi:nucleotidyltransferase/DNA polymerase involved in DNA repair
MIGFLDADCFYVSAERVRDPWLIGKPVGVLGNNGACVIAKSYEMKAAGVRTGEPVWDAVKLCPDGLYIKRDFRWYEVLSRLMLNVVRDVSPVVEYYSIDECFFALPPRFTQDPLEWARGIRDRIRAEVGVPVTIAVARTRTLAKLFADTAKPFGAVAVLDQDHETELMAKLPVTEIAGIAGRRAARLLPYNVRSCLDLARLPGPLVRQLLTVVGERLWWELNGSAVVPLQTSKATNQTVSRGGGFTATADPAVIWAWAVRHVERLIEELDYHQLRAGKLTLFAEHKNAPGGMGVVGFDSATDRFDLLVDAAGDALRQAWRPGLKVCRLDLMATHLRPPRMVQRSLFERPAPGAEAVARLKREVNHRVGRFAVRSGATLPLYQVYRDTAAAYDICDVRGKLCF